jgi:hypothetical protein
VFEGAILCPQGKKVFGGGAHSQSHPAKATVTAGSPITTPTQQGWLYRLSNTSTVNVTFTTFAICAAAN